jgi:hypothetical protein
LVHGESGSGAPGRFNSYPKRQSASAPKPDGPIRRISQSYRRGSSRTTASWKNSEIHSRAAVRSSFVPPTSSNLPSSFLTSRACPKYARTSPSSLPVNNAVNFMGGMLPLPHGQRPSKSKRFPRPPRWCSSRSIRSSEERRYWVI